MPGLGDLATLGKSVVTTRRLLIASVAAAGLYTFGGDGMSYLSTASRMVSSEVADQIPVEFELERAKTMIGDLIPDIKRNMVVIAQEEVSVDNIRAEIDEAETSLGAERDAIVKLTADVDDSSSFNSDAALANATSNLKRRFARFQMGEATLAAKKELLASRHASLSAARSKLERMLNSKRDLEVDVENLEARLRTVQSEAVTSKVEFDESQVYRCEKLVDALRVRLQVAERLLASDGNFDDFQASNAFEGDIVGEINSYFAESSASSSDLATNVR